MDREAGDGSMRAKTVANSGEAQKEYRRERRNATRLGEN